MSAWLEICASILLVFGGVAMALVFAASVAGDHHVALAALIISVILFGASRLFFWAAYRT